MDIYKYTKNTLPNVILKEKPVKVLPDRLIFENFRIESTKIANKGLYPNKDAIPVQMSTTSP